MAIYLIQGRLGAGKSLCAVGRMQDGIREGRRVATNLDVNLVPLLGPRARKARVIRIPDKPSVSDLKALGPGNESYDETQNGLLVLDELATWLNARSFQDAARQPVIDWLVHSRKYGWDVLFIAQDQSQIDKQVRDSLIEYLVTCRRMDRVKIPVVGGLLRALSGGFLSGKMPRLHIAVVRYGTQPTSLVVDRWVYLGNGLFPAYDTRQVFSEDYDSGPYSYLTPWHVEGRHRQQSSLLGALRKLLGGRRSLPPRRAPEPTFPASLLSLPPDQRVRVVRKLIADGAV